MDTNGEKFKSGTILRNRTAYDLHKAREMIISTVNTIKALLRLMAGLCLSVTTVLFTLIY